MRSVVPAVYLLIWTAFENILSLSFYYYLISPISWSLLDTPTNKNKRSSKLLFISGSGLLGTFFTFFTYFFFPSKFFILMLTTILTLLGLLPWSSSSSSSAFSSLSKSSPSSSSSWFDIVFLFLPSYVWYGSNFIFRNLSLILTDGSSFYSLSLKVVIVGWAGESATFSSSYFSLSSFLSTSSSSSSSLSRLRSSSSSSCPIVLNNLVFSS